ncbi:MAG: hypothetical protein A2V85_07430 [Chloroflexi bacterium RBG_16_72_14]|nr:MAG: hypothetical protein A2V85_07430 [Chloroflexi bacterium RBG_16_72_14]
MVERVWRPLERRGLASLVVLTVLVVVLTIADSGFLSAKSVVSLLDQTAVLLLLALAQGIVILMGRIDLANAALASLFTVILALLMPDLGVASVVLILVLGVVVGATQGFIHVFFQVPSFVVTLGTLGIMSGAALILSGASTILVEENREVLAWIYDTPLGLPMAFILAVAAAVILMAAFAILPWGRSVRAVGLNQRAAAYSGIRTDAVVVSGFAVAGLFVALAAIWLLGQLGTSSPRIANTFLLPGIAAVIVGGTSIAGGVGGPGRIVSGALIISVLRIGLDIIHVSSAFQPILYGIVVIVAIAITVDRQRVTTVT